MTQSLHYFTSKIEIKPQRGNITWNSIPDYFTSKIEIKPQQNPCRKKIRRIILHQR